MIAVAAAFAFLLQLLNCTSSAAETDTTYSWKFDTPKNGSVTQNGLVPVKLSPHLSIGLQSLSVTRQVCIQSLAFTIPIENYHRVCFAYKDYQWKSTVMDASLTGHWIGIEASGYSSQGKRIWESSTIFRYESSWKHNNQELYPLPKIVQDVEIQIMSPKSNTVHDGTALRLHVLIDNDFKLLVNKVCTALKSVETSIQKSICYAKDAILSWDYDDVVDTNDISGPFLFTVSGYMDNDLIAEKRCKFTVS
jgi:hypothetical protein